MVARFRKLSKYEPFNLVQRYTIFVMLQAGHSRKVICAGIGKKQERVLSRVLKRNSDQRSSAYRADLAERKCATRHKNKPKHRRFTDEVFVHVDVAEQLAATLSPEQIAVEVRVGGASPKPIYQHILFINNSCYAA